MKKKNLTIWLLLVGLLVLNVLAAKFHSRADLTNEKRFTLTKQTNNVLYKLDSSIKVDVFLKGDYPSGFKKLAGSTEDLLRNFKDLSRGKVQYGFHSPEELLGETNKTFADTLDAMGLAPINLTSQLKKGQQQQFVYPYAMVTYKGRTLPVMLYEGKSPLISAAELNNAEAMLEYNLASAIAKLSSNKTAVVGYMVGNGEPMDISTYDLVENVLKPDYALFTFDPAKQPFVPREFDVLMLVKPTQPFSDEQKLKIDQFVMDGGKLLVLMDRLNADSLQVKNEVVAYDRNLNIYDLLFKYGARVNPDLVMDLQCDFLPFDVNGNGQFEYLPWNYYPVFESPNNHPINKNLGFVSGKFVNSIDTVEADGIKKTVLLSSSTNSRFIGTPAIVSSKENVLAPEDEKFKKAHIPVAVLLEGKFASPYANRLSQAQSDSLKVHGQTFLRSGTKDAKIIVVGDGDLALNETLRNEPLPMGMNKFTYGSQRAFPFANKSFIQNCLAYLTDENNLMEARNKNYVVKMLDTKRVEAEKGKWQMVNIALPILLVILFAVVFQFLRNRKYR